MPPWHTGKISPVEDFRSLLLMDAYSKSGAESTGVFTTPGINILREDDGYRLAQNRPPVGPMLAKLPLAGALEQVARLLPICGKAQLFAARRAVDSARGQIS